MLVKELIDILSKYDPDLPVTIEYKIVAPKMTFTYHSAIEKCTYYKHPYNTSTACLDSLVLYSDDLQENIKELENAIKDREEKYRQQYQEAQERGLF